MPSENDLRESRLSSLHNKFVEAAESYPTLGHVAIRCNPAVLFQILAGPNTADAIPNGLPPLFWRRLRNASDAFVDTDHQDTQQALMNVLSHVSHQAWGTIVANLANLPGHCAFGTRHVLMLNGLPWVGTFTRPRSDTVVGGQSLFIELAGEAWPLVCDSTGVTSNICACSEEMWLGLLHQLSREAPVRSSSLLQEAYDADRSLQEAIEDVTRDHMPLPVGRTGPRVTVRRLSQGVFLACANAVKSLPHAPARDLLATTPRPQAASLLKQPGSPVEDAGGVGKGVDNGAVYDSLLKPTNGNPIPPTLKRNICWHQWYNAEGEKTYHAPAAIRDRWNALSDKERESICPTSSKALPDSGHAAKKNGANTVQKAVSRVEALLSSGNAVDTGAATDK